MLFSVSHLFFFCVFALGDEVGALQITDQAARGQCSAFVGGPMLRTGMGGGVLGHTKTRQAVALTCGPIKSVRRLPHHDRPSRRVNVLFCVCVCAVLLATIRRSKIIQLLLHYYVLGNPRYGRGVSVHYWTIAQAQCSADICSRFWEQVWTHRGHQNRVGPTLCSDDRTRREEG